MNSLLRFSIFVVALFIAAYGINPLYGADYGDGSDGDATVSGYLKLQKDMNYKNLTIDQGAVLDTAGYIVRVSCTLLNKGTIHD